MEFDSRNLLPEIDVEKIEYEVIKEHAIKMDAWIGYALENVEAAVRSNTIELPDREFWISKPIQTFSTPYLDVLRALQEAGTSNQDVVADLGCGFGRVGVVLALRFPGAGFVGVEVVRERLAEAERVLGRFSDLPLQLYQADLRTFDFAEMNVDGRKATQFFIYDFGSRKDFEFVFQSLRKIAVRRPITVIARGGRSRDLIQKTERWLCEVNPPRHFKRFSVYRS